MKFFTLKYCALLFFLINILTGCASQATSKKKATVLKLNTTDQQLISQMYLSNLLNIKLAEEAQTRSTSAETKQLAQIVLTDSKIINTKLHETAGKNATELPLDITPEQVKVWQHFVKEKGLAFDKNFTAVLRHNYEQTSSIFTIIQQQAANKDLKRLADVYKQYSLAHNDQALALEQTLNNRRSRPFETTDVSNTLAKN